MLASADLDDTLNDLLEAPRWYVALSGGLDSTVLLHLLHQWCREHPGAPTLSAVHINHAMQPGSDQWQTQCEQACAALNLDCVGQSVTVPEGASPEAQARAARYAAFEQLLQPREVLFLAHHLDDQVETFFLRLLRGAGLEGLAAMPRSRPLGQGLLVRPLLAVARDAIERFAAQQQLTYIEDPSNSDTRLDRNYLRHEVLPGLAQRWPGYRRSVERASGHLQSAAALLQDSLAPASVVTSVTGDPGVALASLVGVPVSAAAATLRARLRLWGLRAPDQAPLEEFLRQLREAAPEANPQLRWGGNVLQRYRDAIYLLPPDPGGQLPEVLAMTTGSSREVPGVGRLSLQPAEGAGLALSSGDTVQVKWRDGGELCRLPQRPAKPLKKLLQQWAVPPWWRDRVPLIYLGDELLAVGDLALCASSRLAAAGSQGECWALVWEKESPRDHRD